MINNKRNRFFKEALTHAFVLKHFQEFFDAFISGLNSLLLRFDPNFQLLENITSTVNQLNINMYTKNKYYTIKNRVRVEKYFIILKSILKDI